MADDQRTTSAAPLIDLLFEVAGVGLCLVAPDGTVLRANAEWLRSAGATAGQVVGRDVLAPFPDPRDATRELLSRARANQRVEVPRRALRVDGRETWWSGSISPVPLEGGTGLLLTARQVGASGADEALRLAEERFRRVVEQVTDGIFVASPEGRYTDVNPAGCELLGLSRDEVLGSTFLDVLDPEEHHRLPQAIAAFADGKVHRAEWRYRRRDGSTFVGELDGRRFADGQFQGVLRDVTERKQAEQALREATERYHLLFQNMLDGFAYCRMLFDERGRPQDFVYLEVNGAFGRLTGLHDVVGRKVSEVIPGIRESQPELLETYGRVARSGRSERFEVAFRPLGIWLSISVYSPQRDHFVAVFDNITERKRAEEALRHSEERLRALADSMPQLAWTARPDGYITWYNRRWYEYTGTTPGQMEGWEWQSVHDPTTLPDVLRRWKASIASGTAFDMEFPLRGADGTFRRFLTRVFPLKSADGAVLQWFGTNTDVTALVEAQESLQEAARRKDEFLRMLSHELRNPLAPIRNAIYVLEHGDPAGEQAERARGVIRRQTEHLTRLVDDLLDVTRIARGRIELRRSRVDLREVARRAADDFQLVLEGRGIALHAVLGDAKVWADADATRITQVVGNLLHNAAKFTPRGGQVTLSLRAGEGEAELSVRDTGAGIEPALLPHVFDAFVQGERTLARTEGGLGLGLALVKGITELHGGTVRAESTGRDEGAELIVRLPLAAAAALQDAPRTVGERTGGGRRVLVVDDNADAAETLAEILRMAGHAVEVASDGPGALERARARPPDAVLCDIGLPGMSGYEVARALRAGGKGGMLLVALSGYAQPEDVRAALEAGFDCHVAKPCDPAQLERLIR